MVVLTFFVTAQDKIFLQNGDMMEAWVKTITPKVIIYKVTKDDKGPDRELLKDEVKKIVYENGSEDVMVYGTPYKVHNDNIPKEPKRYKLSDYKNNILSISLMNITDVGIAPGLAFERSLDRKGFVGIYLPVAYYLKGWGNDDDVIIQNTPFGEMNIYTRVFQFRPAIKVYPFGNRRKVSYAIGPQFSYAKGYTIRRFHLYSYPYSDIPLNMERMSVLLNNSLNIYPHPKFHIGADLGVGYSVVDRREDLVFPSGGSQVYKSAMKNERKVLVNFSFSMGYRF